MAFLKDLVLKVQSMSQYHLAEQLRFFFALTNQKTSKGRGNTQANHGQAKLIITASGCAHV